MTLSTTAILQPDLFVVLDATLDPRFADNPLVVSDPHIRFYAGAPLVIPDGSSLGTLCVIDHRPRRLSTDQETALRALSRHVVALIELRRLRGRMERLPRARSRKEPTPSLPSPWR